MSKCELCNENHSGIYGSGRFCSSTCARKFSTHSKRKEINKKISKSLKGFKTIPGGKYRVCEYGCGKESKFKLKNGKWCCEDSYTKCINIRKKNSNGLKQAHKEGRAGFPKGSHLKAHKKYRENLKKQYDLLDFIDKPLPEKRRIVLKEQNHKCLICGITHWMGEKLTLHLDHIDGNRKNWSRENLRFVCPNCHSQTNTYCKGTGKKNITNEKLKQLLLETNFNLSKSLELAGLSPGGYNWNRIKSISKKMCQDGVIR